LRFRPIFPRQWHLRHWLPAMLFGVVLWYAGSLLTAEILAIQGSREPTYDKAMAKLTMAVRLMPLDYRFNQYAYVRSIGGPQNGTLQSR
jgi:hypothetical protein